MCSVTLSALRYIPCLGLHTGGNGQGYLVLRLSARPILAFSLRGSGILLQVPADFISCCTGCNLIHTRGSTRRDPPGRLMSNVLVDPDKQPTHMR